ncbi:MAG: penicillin-binding protein 2 [Bacteroidota bacterium]|nr:penicillin-binding protein 2 [Bacteroidota bacterium]MDX5506521.1 penicillin-binding protein 2 [Bacteroidota bacterium]
MERKYLFYIFFLFIGLSFIARLFYLQVLDDSYKLSAENNVVRTLKLYPPRGYVYDRNGQLLIGNQVAYDLMVVPYQVERMDTAAFCQLLDIERSYFDRKIREAKFYSWRKPTIFLTQISKENYAQIQEKLVKYKGFYTQKRILRDYPYSGAANVVGFIGEASDQYLKRHPNYSKGDLIGVAGIDKSYEELLRGKAGVRRVMVDVHNTEKGLFRGGIYDTLPQAGAELRSTIDIDLQLYGERLMAGKRGSIVVIEPSSGEILSLVTSPGYDPNLLVGRQRNRNYTKLYRDSLNKPLFDRGLLAEYPPGSPFKVVNALIGLQEGVITQNTTFTCHHGFHFGRLHVGCHCGGGTMALEKSISKSCNNYYCNVFKRIVDSYPTAQQGMNAWSNHVKSFGLGQFLNNDLPTGRKGFVPDADYYDRSFGYTGWKAVSAISLGIGQGELLVTPIQLANVAAIIANRGWYYTPHIVKEVNGSPIQDDRFSVRRKTTVEEKHFAPIVEGMYQVFETGTARGARIESIPMCGKTGTAENPHGQDHSIFIAFAPKDDPKIAIAIIVENGYWGSRWAAPIASLMMEKYLTDTISRDYLEKRMFEGDLNEEYRKQMIEIYGSDSLYVDIE